MSPLVYWVLHHIGQDAWWDELISLKDYALVEYKTTVTTYPDPNNHILLNLINNAFCRIMGMQDLYQALDRLYLLRVVQLIFTLITILYSYKLMRKFFGKEYSFVVIAMLLSTIPFLNFTLQLRGYNLSMMLVVMTIYYAWDYQLKPRRMILFVFGLCAFLLLYAVPSNVYFLMALGFILLLGMRYSNNKKPKMWLAIMLVAAAILALLAYYPVLDNMLSNRFVAKEPTERNFVLSSLLPTFFYYLFSERWLLLLPITGSIYFLFTNGKGRFSPKVMQLIALLLIPFVLIFVHNKLPFQRTLIHLAPLFAIVLSVGAIYFVQNLKLADHLRTNVIYAISVYCIATGVYNVNQIDQHLVSNLKQEKREQNIYRNYYLASNFTPGELAQRVGEMLDEGERVVLVDEMDRVSLLFYLQKYGVQSYGVVKLEMGTVNAKDKKNNHVAMVQKSAGRGKEVGYMNIPFAIPADAKFKDYKLLLSLHRELEKTDRVFVLSGFPNNANAVLKELERTYNSRMRDTVSFVQVWEVEMKRR